MDGAGESIGMNMSSLSQNYVYNTLLLPPEKCITLKKGFVGLLHTEALGPHDCAPFQFDIERSGLITYLRVCDSLLIFSFKPSQLVFCSLTIRWMIWKVAHSILPMGQLSAFILKV